MMKQSYLTPLAAALMTLLVGCGSDSDPAPTPDPGIPEVPADGHPHPQVFGPMPQNSMVGKHVLFYFGIPVPDEHKDKPILINADDVLRWLDQHHGGESLVNQHRKVFKPGNFSSFDVMVYAVENMKEQVCSQWTGTMDCQLELDYRWNPERRTHDITVNGDYKWNHGYWYWSGPEKDHAANKLEYFGYIRMDETLASDKMNIGFFPVDDMDDQILAQKTEIKRLQDNGGVVIIPNINVQTMWRKDPNVDFVKYYMVSEACYLENKSGDYQACFSPELKDAELDENNEPKYHHGKLVDADGVTKFSSCGISGQKCNDKRFDYTIDNLKVTAHNIRPDIYYDGIITMTDVVLSLNNHSDHSGKHSGSLIYWPIMDTTANPESFAFQSIDGLYASGLHGWLFDWGEVFNVHYYFDSPHIMPDKVVLGSPELIKWRYADFYASYGEWQKVIANDYWDPYKFTRHHVLNPAQPLDSSHFGWKVADCGQCHTQNDMDFQCLESNQDQVLQPARCAECHGSNGAPQGHLEKAACHRCHKDVVGHGDANSANFFVHPFKLAGSGVSREMADPYACVSCHWNETDVLVGGK